MSTVASAAGISLLVLSALVLVGALVYQLCELWTEEQ